MSKYEHKIKELEEQLAHLKAQHANFQALPVNCQLADILHEFDCCLNHTDQCDYFYCNWDDFEHCYGRQKYLRKANSLLEKHNFDTVKSVITIIESNP